MQRKIHSAGNGGSGVVSLLLTTCPLSLHVSASPDSHAHVDVSRAGTTTLTNHTFTISPSPRNRRGTRVLPCSALTTRFGPAFGSAVGTNIRRKGAVQAEGFKLTVVTDCNKGCNWTCAMSCGTECSVGAVVAVQSGLSLWVTGRLLRRLHHGILKLPLAALGRDSRYSWCALRRQLWPFLCESTRSDSGLLV